MPKQKKGGRRGTVVKSLWDDAELQDSTLHFHRSPVQAPYRPPKPVRHVDPALLKRSFMLQNFQFVLRSDLLHLKTTQGLPQGQRRLLECLQSSDSLVPWEAVHSVVVRTTMEEFHCPICLELPTAPRITECGHVYCLPCGLQYMSRQKASGGPRTCPVCHQPFALYTLRPCVLHPIQPLKSGMEVRFDLFKREKHSCILRRYDDPYLAEMSATASSAAIQLPQYLAPSSSQCRYVLTTSDYEANQRYMDGTSISERLQELEGLPRPLGEEDETTLHFLLESLNEVTKEVKALAPSMVRHSPPLAPRAAPLVDGETSPGALLEVYAEGDGQPYFLHMLSVKMLKHDAKLRGTPLPDSVLGRIEEITAMNQTEETRRIYKVFAHVPLHGIIKLAVLDLKTIVLPETMEAFAAPLQKMAQERQQRTQRADQAAMDDPSWRQYLMKYNGPRGSTSGTSPELAPSDFSIDTDSLPWLRLPSTGSAASDHGLPPNPLDTRQRATKRSEGQQPLILDIDALPMEAQQTTDIVPSASASTSESCWMRGTATKLFSKGLASTSSTATTAMWGGHEFHPQKH